MNELATRRTSGVLRPPNGPTRQVLGVSVLDGPVPRRWDAAISDSTLCADEDRVLWIHDRASCYVERGGPVVVEAADELTRLEYDYMVYAMALRTILAQSSRFCLHASAVISPSGRCVAIMGESLAGKSTAVVELIKRGWTFVCDDVLEVDFFAGGMARIVPHERPVHLSDSAVRRLSGEPAMGRPLPGRTKRVYRLDGDLQPRRLAALVLLRADEVLEVEHRRVPTVEATWLTAGHSDVRGICHLPSQRPQFMSWAAAVASSVHVHAVTRPLHGDSSQRVADTIATLS